MAVTIEIFGDADAWQTQCEAHYAGDRSPEGFDLGKACHEIARRIQWAHEALDKHNDPDECRAFLQAADALLGQAMCDCEIVEEGTLLKHADSIKRLWLGAAKLEEESSLPNPFEEKGGADDR